MDGLFKRYGLRRLLRVYEHFAKTDHACNICFNEISPGSLYVGKVYVTERDTIRVLKEHLDPHCPFPDEPEEYSEKEKEEILENLVKEEILEQISRAA